MKRELKEAWVNNLRSGQYDQIHGQLRACGGYCCLGVLCETGIELGLPIKAEEFRNGAKDYNNCDSELDGCLLEILDMDEDDAEECMEMNDNRGYSFEQIADWIEKNVKD